MNKNLAKAFVYRFLSFAFTYPTEELLENLKGAIPDLEKSLKALGINYDLKKLKELIEVYKEKILDLKGEYTYLFETGLKAPIRETAYELEKAGRRVAEMSDINGFYRAFGLEIKDFLEPDNLVAELEFLSFLNQKIYFLKQEGDKEGVSICQEAYEKFLKDHLGRWYEIFTERVKQKGEEEFYKELVNLLKEFLDKETEKIEGIVKLTKYVVENMQGSSWKCGFMQ